VLSGFSTTGFVSVALLTAFWIHRLAHAQNETLIGRPPCRNLTFRLLFVHEKIWRNRLFTLSVERVQKNTLPVGAEK